MVSIAAEAGTVRCVTVTTTASPTSRTEPALMPTTSTTGRVQPQGRRVRRILRHVDVWSVLKFSLLLYACLLVVGLVAGTLLWVAASGAGMIDNIEKFIEGVGFNDFRFLGGALLRAATLSGLVLVVLGTGINVLVAVLYNLISDVVGGVEVTFLEEETPTRRPSI